MLRYARSRWGATGHVAPVSAAVTHQRQLGLELRELRVEHDLAHARGVGLCPKSTVVFGVSAPPAARGIQMATPSGELL